MQCTIKFQLVIKLCVYCGSMKRLLYCKLQYHDREVCESVQTVLDRQYVSK
jgi:hypothetical protein